mmetsp:Transcript_28267/g.68788  ORF Transcript_28267/g.68788 Transcript_28267/m.68788 type:complete len:112 (-) Transcript_28267:269-604(-)
MAGCKAINLFDATMAITGGLSNNNTTATEPIVNGQVKSSEEEDSSCADDPNANCKRFVLILDLYLDEDRSNAVLLEAIRDTVTSEEIATALGTMYPVKTASIPAIVPSANV